MRGLGLLALLILGACSGVPAATPASPLPSATALVACSLPVFWNENIPPPPEPKTHAAFVHLPQGAVSDAGMVSNPPDVSGATAVVGATYERLSKRWLPVRPEAVSPDGAHYAYISRGVHVVNVASGADRVAYGGPTNFILIAFAKDALYLAEATNPRQGVFEKLFRLDLVGGSPRLVPGSDRHMDQSGWVVVSGGAAWGLDYRVQGSAFIYRVLRLDLTSATVTEWLEGPPDRRFSPLGTDDRNRLYVSEGHEVLRLAQPHQVERLLNPPSEPSALTFGSFSHDTRGAWFAGRGQVWLYSDRGGARQFKVGQAEEMVFPAGPCS
jgi:hypothetical protein